MTFLGSHTADDLRALIAAKDFSIAQIKATDAQEGDAWNAVDPSAYADWLRDWTSLVSRYNDARASAEHAIDDATSSAYSSVEDDYQNVLRALTKNPGGGYVKGDLQDVYNRLVDFRKKPVDFVGMPQPTKSDPDLQYLKTSGDVLRAAQQTASATAQAAKQLGDDSGANQALLYSAFALGGGAVLYLALSRGGFSRR